MGIERTFSIIKPDATLANKTGAINALIEQSGLRIIAQRRIRMTKAQAQQFYAVHSERPFYDELVEFMMSGPVVVQVLEGENAIAKYREVMGATNPAEAAEGTIRKLYAKSVGENSVHGSDAAAKRSDPAPIAANYPPTKQPTNQPCLPRRRRLRRSPRRSPRRRARRSRRSGRSRTPRTSTRC